MSITLLMHIMTDLDTTKTNDIRLFLVENDLRHLISQFEVHCINFPEEFDFGSYCPSSFEHVSWLFYEATGLKDYVYSENRSIGTHNLKVLHK